MIKVMNTEKENNIVVVTSFLGAMMVYYDFIIYLLLAPTLTTIFFNSNDEYHIVAIYIIFAAGYLIRPIGGIIVAHFADRISRKFMSLFSILMMAISTVYIGTLPSYNTLGDMAPILLLILRLFQGIAIGAELPAGIALVFEHSPRKTKLFNSSFLVLGVECGILMATCVFFFMHYILTPEEMLVWGWRPPFLLGAILTAVVWSLRIKINDPDCFLRLKEKNKILAWPFVTLIKKYKIEVLAGFMLVFGGFSIFIQLFGVLLPSFLNGYFNYSMQEAHCNVLGFTILYVLFTLMSAYIYQKYTFSITKTIYIFAIILALCSFMIFPVLKSHSYIRVVLLYIVVALSLGFISSIIPYLISNILPTQVRITGIATSYNLAQAIGGGMIPVMLVIFANKQSLLFANSFLMLIAALMIIIAMIILSWKKKRIF